MRATRSGGLRRALRRLSLLGMLAAASVAAAVSTASAVSVCATVETAPAHNPLDAADDAAVWLHPTNPALSTVVGVDKSMTGGGLDVFDPSGARLSFVTPLGGRRSNNDDVRYNFPLGGTRVDLLGVSTRDSRSLDFYTVDPATRTLTFNASVPLANSLLGIARGFAMYHSPVSGKYYAFVTDSGKTQQYELDGSSGKVTGTLVRTLQTLGVTEGLVADDELGQVYVAEEDIGGVWRFGAEPTDPITGVKIITTIEVGGPIVQDIKGLSMYYASGGAGYLIAASQGGDSFHLLNRGDNAYVGEFNIADCTGSNGIDGVTAIDGIDVTNASLGPLFPQGAFISHDDKNPGFNQNYKIVPWQTIANAFTPNLIVDPTFNPRCIGAPGPCAGNPPPTPGGTPGGSTGGVGGPGSGGGAVTGGRSNIYRVQLDGSGLRRLTSAPAGVSYASPAWSRNGRLIAFSGPTCAGCASGIFVVPAAGGAQRRVTGTPLGATRPSWGRLDRLLTFVAGTTSVYSISPLGTGRRRLASGGAVRDQSVWSPDGRQIAFTSQQWNGAWDLWVMNADGGRKRNLTRTLRSEREPAWSHSGRRIAFARRVGGKWAVFVMPATGGPARRLTPASTDCRQPAWSPDDRQIACASAGAAIVLMRADGTRRRRLATGTVTAAAPTWSPDDRSIAFASNG